MRTALDAFVARNRLDSHSDWTIDSKRRGVNGRTRSHPKTAPTVPSSAGPSGNGSKSAPSPSNRARSSITLKATMSPARLVPSPSSMVGVSSPTSTWALVAIRSPPTAKPLPSVVRPHAIPVTRTVDCATSSRTLAVRPSVSGGRPGSGGDAKGGRPDGDSLEVTLPHPAASTTPTSRMDRSRCITRRSSGRGSKAGVAHHPMVGTNGGAVEVPTAMQNLSVSTMPNRESSKAS